MKKYTAELRVSFGEINPYMVNNLLNECRFFEEHFSRHFGECQIEFNFNSYKSEFKSSTLVLKSEVSTEGEDVNLEVPLP